MPIVLIIPRVFADLQAHQIVLIKYVWSFVDRFSLNKTVPKTAKLIYKY